MYRSASAIASFDSFVLTICSQWKAIIKLLNLLWRNYQFCFHQIRQNDFNFLVKHSLKECCGICLKLFVKIAANNRSININFRHHGYFEITIPKIEAISFSAPFNCSCIVKYFSRSDSETACFIEVRFSSISRWINRNFNRKIFVNATS